MKVRKLILIMLLFLLPLSIAACTSSPVKEQPVTEKQTTPEEQGKDVFPIEDLPQIDGSTSTLPLRKLLVCNLLGIECERIIDQHTFTPVAQFPIATIVRDTQDFDVLEKGIYVNTLPNSGTHGSYLNLLSGEKDLVLVAREPSESELRIAKEKGIEIDVEPIALDAFVFILNTENKVDSMTIEEAGKIFAGKILNWHELGGADQTIVPFHRNHNSACRELMDKLVMNPLNYKYSSDILDHQILNSMRMPIDTISTNTGGIAYTVHYYEYFMVPSNRLKLVRINDIAPSYETIKSGDYPLVAPVYAATRADLPDNTNAAQMKKWLLSEQGQKIIRKSGYVPISAAKANILE